MWIQTQDAVFLNADAADRVGWTIVDGEAILQISKGQAGSGVVVDLYKINGCELRDDRIIAINLALMAAFRHGDSFSMTEIVTHALGDPPAHEVAHVR